MPLKLFYPASTIRDAIASPGGVVFEKGDLAPFYQTLDMASRVGDAVDTATYQYRDEPQFAALEQEVVNPAQSRDHIISELLQQARRAEALEDQARLFEDAATRIMSQPAAADTVRRLYRLPGLPGPKFLVPRLQAMFGKEETYVEGRSVLVDGARIVDLTPSSRSKEKGAKRKTRRRAP